MAAVTYLRTANLNILYNESISTIHGNYSIKITDLWTTSIETKAERCPIILILIVPIDIASTISRWAGPSIS